MGSKVSHQAEILQVQPREKSRNADGNSRPDYDVTETAEQRKVMTSQTTQERVASWVISCQQQENKNIKTSTDKKGGFHLKQIKRSFEFIIIKIKYYFQNFDG